MKFFLLKGIFVVLHAAAVLSGTVRNKPKVESKVEKLVAAQKTEAKPQVVVKEVVISEKAEKVPKQEASVSTMETLKKLTVTNLTLATNVTSRQPDPCYYTVDNPCGDNPDTCFPVYGSDFIYCFCSDDYSYIAFTCRDPCLGVDCGVGEYCFDGGCLCQPNYFLLEGKCYEDPCFSMDADDSNPCNNAGDFESVCVPDYLAGTHTCTCSTGFRFFDGICKDPCFSMDAADSNPCNNGGDPKSSCVPDYAASKYTCACSAGFRFLDGVCKDGCASLDRSDSNPCNNNGDLGSKCMPNYANGTYNCNCSSGWVASDGFCINPCLGVDCGTGGSCVLGSCVCKANYSLCEGKCYRDPCFSMDAADSNPCNNAGDFQSVCVHNYIASTYTCTCSIGFRFLDGICKDACASADKSDSNPCNNNGDLGSTCHTNYYDGTYNCNCSSGWVVSGGSCKNPCLGVDCGTGGSCFLGSCVCEVNYSLYKGKCYRDPCFSMDATDSNPCNNGGDSQSHCVPDYVANTYTCTCSVGFRFLAGICRDACASGDLSDSNPCNNNGDHKSTCLLNYSDGNYRCMCSKGWVVGSGSCTNPCLGVQCPYGEYCVLGRCEIDYTLLNFILVRRT